MIAYITNIVKRRDTKPLTLVQVHQGSSHGNITYMANMKFFMRIGLRIFQKYVFTLAILGHTPIRIFYDPLKLMH